MALILKAPRCVCFAPVMLCRRVQGPSIRYLKEGDIDWAYWQLNGTPSDSLFHPGRRKLRHHGALDWYGLLNRRWNAPTDARNAERIKALQKMTQHP
jgi:hypothetical protein